MILDGYPCCFSYEIYDLYHRLKRTLIVYRLPNISSLVDTHAPGFVRNSTGTTLVLQCVTLVVVDDGESP